MNMTAVTITALICLTLIILGTYDKHDDDK